MIRRDGTERSEAERALIAYVTDDNALAQVASTRKTIADIRYVVYTGECWAENVHYITSRLEDQSLLNHARRDCRLETNLSCCDIDVDVDEQVYRSVGSTTWFYRPLPSRQTWNEQTSPDMATHLLSFVKVKSVEKRSSAI
jgi:hypothetical protein